MTWKKHHFSSNLLRSPQYYLQVACTREMFFTDCSGVSVSTSSHWLWRWPFNMLLYFCGCNNVASHLKHERQGTALWSEHWADKREAIVLGSKQSMGFPGGASDKESVCQCRRCKSCGFNPWVRKIPWSGKRQPTPVFLARKFHGREPGGLHSMELQRVRHDWAPEHMSNKRCTCGLISSSQLPVRYHGS